MKATNLGMMALTAVNPAAAATALVGKGLGEGANLLRHRAAADNVANVLPNLGKTLTNHQVVPAVRALAANAPLTDIGKVVLSATGGNPAQIADRAFGIAKTTMKLSPHDKRMTVKSGLSKISPHANSIGGLL